jgi:ribosomal protein S18 acetylase RimI-like enzyme
VAEIRLRHATPGDARAIAAIHVAAWRAAYRTLLPDSFLAALDIEEHAAKWSSALSRPSPSRVALAERDGALVGFCSYGATRDDEAPDVAEIYALNVHPDHWRQGAGRALCAEAYREAAVRGHSAITLWVMAANGNARRFYQDLGYASDGGARRNVQFIAEGFDEVRHRKVIA